MKALEARQLSSSLLIWCGAAIGAAGWAAAFTPAGAVMVFLGPVAIIAGLTLEFTRKQLLWAGLAVVLAWLFVPAILVRLFVDAH